MSSWPRVRRSWSTPAGRSASGPIDIYARHGGDDPTQVISTSWGLCEPEMDPAGCRRPRSSLFAQAAAQGQTHRGGGRGTPDRRTASSAGPLGGDTSLQVDDPADQPYVTGAGGTSILSPRLARRPRRCGIRGRGPAPVGEASRRLSPSRRGSPAPGWMPRSPPPSARRSDDPAAGRCPTSRPGRPAPWLHQLLGRGLGGGRRHQCGVAPVGGAAGRHRSGAARPPSGYQPRPVLVRRRPAFNDVTTGNNDMFPSRSALHYPATAGLRRGQWLGVAVGGWPLASTWSPGRACTKGLIRATGWARVGDGGIFSFGARRLLRLDRASDPATGPIVRHGPLDPGGAARRLLAGGLRRRHLHLRRRRLPRLDRGRCRSTGPSWAWPPPPTAAATGWWPPTAGIFTFGDAGFYGSTGAAGPQPAHRRAWRRRPTAAATGWWPPTAGIFTFGDAGFYGSTGGLPLNQPIVGMAATPDGGGYWLVASDGGHLHLRRRRLPRLDRRPCRSTSPIVGMAATPDGGGYWLVASDGGIFTFGDARLLRLDRRAALNRPIVGMAST